tara:strand:- start:852 stop:989 length:138 start_codon:yes stop_codon:yes gene_type:complete
MAIKVNFNEKKLILLLKMTILFFYKRIIKRNLNLETKFSIGTGIN